MEEIKPELVMNWEQNGMKIVPPSSCTMDKRGNNRVEMIGVDDKCLIKAIFCGTLVGDFLPSLFIREKHPGAILSLNCHQNGI